MREQVDRTGFPKTGDYLSVVKFVCNTPPTERERIYAAPVKGKPGLYNFALFPAPVQLTDEQTELLRAAETVAKLTASTPAVPPK
jgi:hypothetical protein